MNCLRVSFGEIILKTTGMAIPSSGSKIETIARSSDAREFGMVNSRNAIAAIKIKLKRMVLEDLCMRKL